MLVMQKFAGFVRSSSLVLLGTVAVVTPVAALVSASPQRPLFRTWGRGILVVTSGSMSPSIRTGDIVVLRSVRMERDAGVRTGTVVTFRSAGTDDVLVTHRVVGTAHNASGRTVLVTKGDANPTVDLSPLTPDRIIGEPTVVIPRAGFLLAALTMRRLPLLFGAALLLAHISVTLVRPARRATQQHTEIPEVTGP